MPAAGALGMGGGLSGPPISSGSTGSEPEPAARPEPADPAESKTSADSPTGNASVGSPVDSASVGAPADRASVDSPLDRASVDSPVDSASAGFAMVGPSRPETPGSSCQPAMASAEEVLDVIDGVRPSCPVGDGDGMETGTSGQQKRPPSTSDDSDSEGLSRDQGAEEAGADLGQTRGKRGRPGTVEEVSAAGSSSGQAAMAAALGDTGFSQNIVAPFSDGFDGADHA